MKEKNPTHMDGILEGTQIAVQQTQLTSSKRTGGYSYTFPTNQEVYPFLIFLRYASNE